MAHDLADRLKALDEICASLGRGPAVSARTTVVKMEDGEGILGHLAAGFRNGQPQCIRIVSPPEVK